MEAARRPRGAQAGAFAEDKHGQTAAHLVVGAEGKGAPGTGETQMLREKGNVHSEERIAGGERNVYLNMAVA